MKLSLKVALPVAFLIVFTISSCSNQLVAAPPVANLPEEILYTPTVMADATAPPEPAPTSEPTPTTEIKICSTSVVRAIPEYNKKNLLTSFQTMDPFVVLTIDDGYSNTVFDQMLEILKAHDTTATFFLVGNSFGEKIKKETLLKLVENGNEIAYHSLAHPEVSIIEGMSYEDWLLDYQQWSETLLAVIGQEAFEKGVVPYARAPYGAWTTAFMSALDELGLEPVHWNADEYTFEPNRTPLREGSILILHVIPENLDELEKLMATGWQVISLRQALGEVCD